MLTQRKVFLRGYRPRRELVDCPLPQSDTGLEDKDHRIVAACRIERGAAGKQNWLNLRHIHMAQIWCANLHAPDLAVSGNFLRCVVYANLKLPHVQAAFCGPPGSPPYVRN